MSEDIVKDSIKCLANMKIEETTYQVARNVVLEEIERLKEQLKDEIDEELKQSEIMVKKQQEIERLNNGLKDIKWFIEKNKTSFSDLYIPASDVVSILVIIDRLLGSDKE